MTPFPSDTSPIHPLLSTLLLIFTSALCIHYICFSSPSPPSCIYLLLLHLPPPLTSIDLPPLHLSPRYSHPSLSHLTPFSHLTPITHFTHLSHCRVRGRGRAGHPSTTPGQRLSPPRGHSRASHARRSIPVHPPHLPQQHPQQPQQHPQQHPQQWCRCCAR